MTRRGGVSWLFAAVLLAGPGGAPGRAQERAPAARYQKVTVRPGDTLWAIANAYLKDPTRWNELLKYNKLPTSDPTVALPGMALRVPVAMIKESMLAASLVLMINEVLTRKRETPEWKPATQTMQLFRDDGLRTMASSRARVRFVNGEMLNLDQNSMAILKPRDKNADLELMRGVIHAAQARVITASARITPKTKDTRFSAQVREDLSTLVQVYTGLAAVEGQGQTLDVRGGFSTEVAADSGPADPIRLPETPEFLARALGQDVFDAKLLDGEAGKVVEAGGSAPTWRLPPGSTLVAARPRDIEQIGFDLKALQVGVPVAAFNVQAARDRDFTRVALKKTFEADERIDLSRSLPPGRYWFRVAVVDLLGVQGRFSDARQYNVSERGAERVEEETLAGRFDVIRPPEGDEFVWVPKYRLVGKAESGLTVTINGRRVRMDEDGNFMMDVLLKEGPNRYIFYAQDPRGREREIIRKIVYEP